jgi:integrase
MTKLRPSLTSSGDEEVAVTLADVLARILKLDRLSPGRRGDLKCAVKKLAKIAGLTPEEAPINLAFWQKQLDGLLPVKHGMTRERWSSIKSDFLCALRLTGFAEPLQTTKAMLLPTWSAVLDACVYRHHRVALSRYGRFCSLNNIEPDYANEDVFHRFAEALKRNSLVSNPGKVLRQAAYGWNAICRARSDFGGEPLPLPSNKPKPTRIAFEEMPRSFGEDLERYSAWCAMADPLDDDARARPLRPSTIELNRHLVQSAATAAIEGSIAKERLTSLGSLVAPKIFTAILRRRYELDNHKPSAFTQAIATRLIIIAREWVKLQPAEIGELKRLRSKMPRLKTGLTPKNQNFLDQFENPALEAGYLALPDILWREAVSGKLKPYKALVRAQLSLAIDLELHLGLRAANLIALSFVQHLSWPAGPRGPVLVRIDGREMKSGRDYEAELPADLGKRLLHYRDKMVPAVIGKCSGLIFVTREGRPKNQETLAVQFQQVVRQRLGIRMTLHQNRHLGVKRMLDDNPGLIERAQQWSGHLHLKTTTSYYGGTDTRRAVQYHSMLIERRRELTRHLLKRRRRSKSSDDKGRK